MMGLLSDLAVTALFIIGGLVMLYIFAVVISTLNQQGSDMEIDQLNEQHLNLSAAENAQRIALLNRKRRATGREKQRLEMEYQNLKACHEEQSMARFKHIIDLEVPYDEEAMASVQRGENPYRRK